jgi:hypothetical protein
MNVYAYMYAWMYTFDTDGNFLLPQDYGPAAQLSWKVVYYRMSVRCAGNCIWIFLGSPGSNPQLGLVSTESSCETKWTILEIRNASLTSLISKSSIYGKDHWKRFLQEKKRSIRRWSRQVKGYPKYRRIFFC